MTAPTDPALACVQTLVPAILRALHAIEFAARHVAPATLPRLVEALTGRGDDLAPALAEARAVDWPGGLVPMREALEIAGGAAQGVLAELRAAPGDANPMLAAYRSLRGYSVACGALYPLARFLRPVSRFFIEAERRDDAALLDALAVGTSGGLFHLGGAPGTRGGASLYVPETAAPEGGWPLVVALHGGSGNGAAFLWSWLRVARTRGVAVLAPTAKGATWSLMEPDIDGPNIAALVEAMGEAHPLHPTRRLLTGMSDGGTFSYVLGIATGCPYSHVAPVSASFHPMMMAMADPARVAGLPMRIVHGALDWMFSSAMAMEAERAFAAAGARVELEIVDDLSHTYPRDANPRLLDWFLTTPVTAG